jgi:hypothetical protein
MTTEYHLDVPLITQIDCKSDTPEMCGAACVQMVLHDIDPLRNQNNISGEQTNLYSSITNNSKIGTGSWYNPPDGIAKTLNMQHPPMRVPGRELVNLPYEIQQIFSSIPLSVTQGYHFSIVGGSANGIPGIPKAYDSTLKQIAQIELISRLLIRTITISGSAPIVAVREDNAHWIVVNGFQVDANYVDTGAVQPDMIKSMIIRNPLGRYNYRDIKCASLPQKTLEMITGHKCEENPYQQDIVAYETWVREYMLDYWGATFVIVCDQPGQVAHNLVKDISALSQPSTQIASREPSQNPISPEDAEERARTAINEYKLQLWNDGITGSHVLSPIKVKRLDRIDGDYYLVPVGIGDHISTLINISVTGEFSEATVWPPGHFITSFESHPSFGNLTGDKSILRGKKLRLRSDDSLFEIATVTRDANFPYVWRPCYESFSSFKPFHHLKVHSTKGEITSVYLPVDNYCLSEIIDPDTGELIVPLPSPNYLELLAACIKQRLKNIGEVLTRMNRRGTTLLVEYQTLKKRDDHIIEELKSMERAICQCLLDRPLPKSLINFRIKAFKTSDFLRRKSGGGGDDPLPAVPRSGGGGNDGIEIAKCKQFQQS